MRLINILLMIILLLSIFPVLVSAQISCSIVNSGDPLIEECENDDSCYVGSASGGKVAVCQLPSRSEPEPECTTDSDCNSGFKCENEECVMAEPEPECTNDNDCGANSECNNGECQTIEIEQEQIEEVIEEEPMPEDISVEVNPSLGPSTGVGPAGGRSLGTVSREIEPGVIERAELRFQLTDEEINGVQIKVPKLNFKLDVKKPVKVSPLLDVTPIPYRLYLITPLLVILGILLMLIIKDAIAPRINYKKGRKGQIFLIAAVIFVLALYSVVVPYNTIKTYPTLEDYKSISDNYKTEFPKVFNWALYHGLNIDQALEAFNAAFLGQARQIDPKFGVFYLFKDAEGKVHIINSLNKKAIVISYEDPVTADQVTIELVGEGGSEGNICVNNLPCNSPSANLGDFDTAFYRSDIDEMPTELQIRVAGEEGGISIPLNEQFSSLTYSRDEREIIEREAMNIQVRVDEY